MRSEAENLDNTLFWSTFLGLFYIYPKVRVSNGKSQMQVFVLAWDQHNLIPFVLLFRLYFYIKQHKRTIPRAQEDEKVTGTYAVLL